MPNYPYDLANAPAPTANYRSPFGRGQTLAVSAAAVTDHVCDSGHGLTVSKASLSGLEEAHSGWGQRSHGICGVPGEIVPSKGVGGRSPVSRAAQPGPVTLLVKKPASGLERRMAYGKSRRWTR